MSEFVRLGGGTGRVVRVELKMFERLTHNQAPWVQQSRGGKGKQRFGQCPECDGAMLLVNITNSAPQQTPHGRHRLTPVKGFAFNLERILGCELLDPSRLSQVVASQMELTAEAVARRSFLVEHFNLAVGILQEDIGLQISRPLAGKILAGYFAEHWYRWSTATLGNLPWLFMRTATAFNPFGQRFRAESDVTRSILTAVPEAMLGPYNRLMARPGHRLNLVFGLRDHEIRSQGSGSTLETINFFVARSAGPDGSAGELVFEQTITMRPKDFLERVAHKTPPSGYGLQLVETARAALESYLRENVHAVDPKETPDA